VAAKSIKVGIRSNVQLIEKFSDHAWREERGAKLKNRKMFPKSEGIPSRPYLSLQQIPLGMYRHGIKSAEFFLAFTGRSLEVTGRS